jgi:urease accessory protein
MMARATSRIKAGQWHGSADGELVLGYDDRHRRRLVVESLSGERILLDFPETIALAGGDALLLEDGRRIAVTAKAEALMIVRPVADIPLARIAWHIGNRHLACEIHADQLVLRYDHVIAEMLMKLGATTTLIEAPFDPEGGAYGIGATLGHSHSHAPHDHGHDE